MNGEVYFCYQWVLCRRGYLSNAIMPEQNKYKYDGENIWLGVGTARTYYKLTIEEVNRFLRKYLIKR